MSQVIRPKVGLGFHIALPLDPPPGGWRKTPTPVVETEFIGDNKKTGYRESVRRSIPIPFSPGRFFLFSLNRTNAVFRGKLLPWKLRRRPLRAGREATRPAGRNDPFLPAG